MCMWCGLLAVLCSSLSCRTQPAESTPSCSSSDGGCEGGEGASLSQFLQPEERLVQEVDSQTDISGDQEMGDSRVRDVYFSIRTTLKYHSVRLPAIFLTWMQKVSPSQVPIFISSYSKLVFQIFLCSPQIHLVTERVMSGSDDVWVEKATASGMDMHY